MPPPFLTGVTEEGGRPPVKELEVDPLGGLCLRFGLAGRVSVTTVVGGRLG